MSIAIIFEGLHMALEPEPTCYEINKCRCDALRLRAFSGLALVACPYLHRRQPCGLILRRGQPPGISKDCLHIGAGWQPGAGRRQGVGKTSVEPARDSCGLARRSALQQELELRAHRQALNDGVTTLQPPPKTS